MDLDKIHLPSPKHSRVLTGPLPDLDYYKFKVSAKLLKKSMSVSGQTAIITYLRRNWEKEHEQLLIYEAAQRGISPEELFMELASDDGDISATAD